MLVYFVKVLLQRFVASRLLRKLLMSLSSGQNEGRNYNLLSDIAKPLLPAVIISSGKYLHKAFLASSRP